MAQQDFEQTGWDAAVVHDLRQILRLAISEDLGREYDWTTLALVPSDASAAAEIVSRADGILAGIETGPVLLDEMNSPASWYPLLEDGREVRRGDCVARLSGPARDLLTAERILLNTIGHLSGIATLTSRYVAQVKGTQARIYDTRKTTPGWRRLEKYAVRCGGGWNHRRGLNDAILIKDNHLAFGASQPDARRFDAVRAVQLARELARNLTLLVEVEVDALEQLRQVLTARPDLVLLDNMDTGTLREAVRIRNQLAPGVELEASGGVTLQTVRQIAESGVNRISVGALTHSAPHLDLGMEWRPAADITA